MSIAILNFFADIKGMKAKRHKIIDTVPDKFFKQKTHKFIQPKNNILYLIRAVS